MNHESTLQIVRALSEHRLKKSPDASRCRRRHARATGGNVRHFVGLDAGDPQGDRTAYLVRAAGGRLVSVREVIPSKPARGQ